jgi:hypothetical protein
MQGIGGNIAIVTIAVSIATVLVSYITYLGRVRELRLTANERMMRMVIDIDKEMIARPELMWVTRPDELPKPDINDPLVRARLKAFMYMHLNMFDVAFNYYNRTLGMTWFKRTFFLSREEIDHWEGWKTYMGWFILIDFVKENFVKEAHRWFGEDFKSFLFEIINKQPKRG